MLLCDKYIHRWCLLMYHFVMLLWFASHFQILCWFLKSYLYLKLLLRSPSNILESNVPVRWVRQRERLWSFGDLYGIVSSGYPTWQPLCHIGSLNLYLSKISLALHLLQCWALCLHHNHWLLPSPVCPGCLRWCIISLHQAGKSLCDLQTHHKPSYLWL